MGASTANPTFSLNAFFAPQPSSELVFTKPQNSEPTSNRVLGLHTCTNEQFSYDMALHRIVEVLLFSLQSTFEMYICQARKAKKKKVYGAATTGARTQRVGNVSGVLTSQTPVGGFCSLAVPIFECQGQNQENSPGVHYSFVIMHNMAHQCFPPSLLSLAEVAQWWCLFLTSLLCAKVKEHTIPSV